MPAATGSVQKIDLNKFTLVGENTTSYTTYTSGGTAKENLLDQFELDGENSTSHTTYVSSGNATRVVVDDFYLSDENGLTHDAYTSGGTVKAVSGTSLKLKTLAGVNLNGSAFTPYSSGGTLTAIHEVSTPYAVDDLVNGEGIPLIQFAQSKDHLFLAHPEYHPRQVLLDDGDFLVEAFPNEEGPFLDQNATDTTIYVTGQTGVGSSVTLTSNMPLFDSDHVGALWRLRLKDGAETVKWESAKAFTLGQEVISGDLFYRCTDAGTSGTEAPVHDVGEQWDGADTATNALWRYIHNGRGDVIITDFISASQVTATILSELPAGLIGAQNATARWNEGAWSEVQGYPRSVAIHEQRLVWGGTAEEPLSMDFSSTRSVYDNNPIELDGTVTRATAFRRVLDSENPIRWMRSTEKGLIVGTLAGEWVVAVEGTSTQGFGADTAVARQFSANGAAAIQPIRNGDSLLYPQRARKRMRDITFSTDQQKLVTSDRNLRSDHILKAGVIATAYAEEPHRVMWNLLGDGKLAGLTYNREPGAQVSAWHGHTIAGSFGSGDAVVESVTVIPSPDETTDDLWVSVKRTINSQTVRYVEYLSAPLDDGEDIVDGTFMDSCISYDGSPISVIGGLGHLEGATVAVLADGVYTTGTVVSAALTLPEAASVVHTGIYTKRVLETVEIESAPGSPINTKMLNKRVTGVQIEVVESADAYVGTSADDMDRMEFDEFYDVDGAPRRITGPIEETVNDDFGKRKTIRVEQRKPYPFCVTSLTAQFEVGADG